MVARKRNAMPEDIEFVLAERALRGAYDERPAYQRNDYLGWIARAKTPPTREKRLSTMLNELERGGVYMGMDHAPSRRELTRG